MAIYHQSVKPIQRSKGRTATAAAAYRSGQRIQCEFEGIIHDYTRRRGVEHTELLGWSGDRESLWNAAECAERRKDGTPAREYEIALPVELDPEERVNLAREYAGWLARRHGVAVDIAVHSHDSSNPHCHLLTTTRRVSADGLRLTRKAPLEWSDTARKSNGLLGRKSELEAARLAWCRFANRALARANASSRIDHRSLAVQRDAALARGDQISARLLDREPQTKLGWMAMAMEAKGMASDRGAEHRAREQRNKNQQARYAKLDKIEQQIKATTHTIDRPVASAEPALDQTNPEVSVTRDASSSDQAPTEPSESRRLVICESERDAQGHRQHDRERGRDTRARYLYTSGTVTDRQCQKIANFVQRTGFREVILAQNRRHGSDYEAQRIWLALKDLTDRGVDVVRHRPGRACWRDYLKTAPDQPSSESEVDSSPPRAAKSPATSGETPVAESTHGTAPIEAAYADALNNAQRALPETDHWRALVTWAVVTLRRDGYEPEVIRAALRADDGPYAPSTDKKLDSVLANAETIFQDPDEDLPSAPISGQPEQSKPVDSGPSRPSSKPDTGAGPDQPWPEPSNPDPDPDEPDDDMDMNQ